MDQKAQKILDEIMEKERQEHGTDPLVPLSGDEALAGKFETALETFSSIEADELLQALQDALDQLDG